MTEVKVSELVAFLVKDKESDRFKIPFDKIHELSRKLETVRPDIHAMCDVYDLEYFSGNFPQNMTVVMNMMTDKFFLQVEQFCAIKDELKRFEPNEEITKILEIIK